MNKKIGYRKAIIGVIIILFIIILMLLLFKKDLNLPKDPDSQETVIYEVESGMDSIGVSQDLEDLGLIQDDEYLYDLFLENDGIVYANSYELSPAMTSQEIYDIITSPTTNIVSDDINTLLIFEGQNVPGVASDIAQILDVSEQSVLDYWSDQDNLNTWISEYSVLTDDILDEDILYPLEGYLYPATYPIDEGESIKSITKKILDTTQDRYLEYLNQEYPNDYTFHEILTLASIVERETMHQSDRAKVAGVFYNRIKEGMPLQSDITVLYAMGIHKEDVLYEDLTYPSPYNTYSNSGLPPSPISSVSKESLEATINPETNDYYYFFAKQDTGEVLYSKTYEEHLEIAEKYAWDI